MKPASPAGYPWHQTLAQKAPWGEQECQPWRGGWAGPLLCRDDAFTMLTERARFRLGGPDPPHQALAFATGGGDHRAYGSDEGTASPTVRG